MKFTKEGKDGKRSSDETLSDGQRARLGGALAAMVGRGAACMVFRTRSAGDWAFRLMWGDFVATEYRPSIDALLEEMEDTVKNMEGADPPAPEERAKPNRRKLGG